MNDNVIPFARRISEAEYWAGIRRELDDFSRDMGTEHVPHEVFPLIVQMMVDWADAIHGCDFDLETAECLAECIKTLADCQKRCMRNAVTDEIAGINRDV
jgi:hypothetical protein